MSKLLVFVFLLLALVTGCSSSKEPPEVLKISDSTNISLDFREIKDKNEINQIQEIVDRLEWSDEAIETEGNPDYSFWLERKDEELRITNYEVWFKGEESVIIDHVRVKFAYIKGVDMQELKNRLEATSSSN